MHVPYHPRRLHDPIVIMLGGDRAALTTNRAAPPPALAAPAAERPFDMCAAQAIARAKTKRERQNARRLALSIKGAFHV